MHVSSSSCYTNGLTLKELQHGIGNHDTAQMFVDMSIINKN
jgi:hypothetical protein